MATEKEADLARAQHSARLRALGAHAIAVDQVRRAGRGTFAVVAMFEEKPRDLPKTLDAKVGDRIVAVPLIAKKTEQFKPE